MNETLSISFVDRRKDGVKRWRAVPITEADLHQFWLDKHLLTVLTPAYILYPSLKPESHDQTHVKPNIKPLEHQ